MEQLNDDRFIRELMHESRLEITSESFERQLMQKITSETKKRSIANSLVLYVVIFLTTDMILFALIKLLNLNILFLSAGVNDIKNKALNGAKAFDNGFAENAIIVCIFFSLFLLFYIIREIASHADVRH